MKTVSWVVWSEALSSGTRVEAGRLVVSAGWWVVIGLVFFASMLRGWAGDCIPPPAGLVAWWLGEGDANDIAGANNGTFYGGVTITNGMVGQGFTP